MFKDKIKNIGRLPEILKKKFICIDKSRLNEGVNDFDEIIIFKKKKSIIAYNRICDHLGGKLITKGKQYLCPIHNWKFDPATGAYFNKFKKTPLLIEELQDQIKVCLLDKKPKIQKKLQFNNNLNIRFLNHAFLIVSNSDFSFATDPWATGPAFINGWWLKNKTKNDWVEKLNNCDFVYISHNHPDHLNEYTLNYLNKEMPIVVPDFKDRSTEIKLKNLGFKNVIPLCFNDVYNFKNSNLNFTILKSGDFHNDSGIYFSVGNTSCLFDVDSNSINFLNLPIVDLYASSYSNGAGGYPIIFDSYSNLQKNKIMNIKNNFFFFRKIQNLKKLKAKYFLPYASSFIAKLKTDDYIEKNNLKIGIEKYKKTLLNECAVMEVETKDSMDFLDGKLIGKNKISKKLFKSISDKKIVSLFKKDYSEIDNDELKKYFYDSKFKDSVVLFLSLTNTSFDENYLNLCVDFSGSKVSVKFLKNKIFKINDYLKRYNNRNIIHIKARKEAFNYIIKTKSSWEDMAIGFQIRVYRYPNEYNFKFAQHFQYNYLSKENKKTTADCSICKSFIHLVDKEITKKMKI